MIWSAVLVGSLACYLLKLLGFSVPQRWLEQPTMQRITVLIPIALLSALVGLWTFASGPVIGVDARVLGLGTAALLLVIRAPFLVVILGAAAVTAIVRALGWMP